MVNSVSKQSKKRVRTTISVSHSTGNTSSEKTGLKPTKANRKKFDLDLAYGELHETEFLNVLKNKKVEVKTERDKWVKTGNICIEYQSYGKPSGIDATEADYWVHNLAVGDDVYCRLLFSVDTLRKIIREPNKFKTVFGGDNNASRMYLIKLSKLFTKEQLEIYSNLSTLVKDEE